MRLIDDAGVLWHQLWSMRLIIATTVYNAAAGAWLVLPVDWKPTLTHTEQMVMAGIGMLIPVSAGFARVVRQDKATSAPSSNDTMGHA